MIYLKSHTLKISPTKNYTHTKNHLYQKSHSSKITHTKNHTQ